MKYLPFGSEGRMVSVIGAGVMRIAGMNVSEADTFVRAAMDNGITFFDHADIYGGGQSERIFGEVLAKDATLRDKMFLQSKCGIRQGMFDFSKEHILEAVEGILSRLGTDHLDSLLLHRPDALMEPEEVGEAFDTLFHSGKVRNFGVSNMNPMQMELLKTGLSFPIAADQVQMSIAHTPMLNFGFNTNMTNDAGVNRDGGLLEYCRLHQIIVQTWSPLQKGFFGGTFLGDPDYAELNQVLEELAAKYNVNPDSVAYAWLLRYPAKMQVITGTTNPARLASAAKAADFTLTREEWYRIYLAAGNRLP